MHACFSRLRVPAVVLIVVAGSNLPTWAGSKRSASPPAEVAAQVDGLLANAAKAAGVEPAPLANDADFLRRVSLDLVGQIPRPGQLTLFEVDPRPDKRSAVIDRLLDEEDYARNWTAYWRDVIYRRATNMRAGLSRGAFEAWLQSELAENRPWDEIVTEMITASGDVQEVGAAGLIFAQEGQPTEIAAEVSRIFLGVQIQCANCHDHPWDQWKREQFHELAAYFPRITLRRERVDGQAIPKYIVQSRDREQTRRGPTAFMLRRVDRNRDGVLSQRELKQLPRIGDNYDRFLGLADKNKDGRLTIEEAMTFERPQNDRPGQGSLEHFMPDLNDPGSPGTRVDPDFFALSARTPAGLDDLERRNELARLLTSKQNPWFARAFVNRMWTQLLGEGFYNPVDDLGPGRSAQHEDVLQLLATEFVASDYDIKWLLRTITSTHAYQRQLRNSTGRTEGDAFAAATPMRLRGDQLFDTVMAVLGPRQGAAMRGRGPMMGGYGRRGGPREQVNALFGYDPSTPQDDLAGSIPQALFLMNSPQVNRAISGTGPTTLAAILRTHADDRDALAALYRLVLCRKPSDREVDVCLSHIAAAHSRAAGFEDVMWSLLNSAEFMTRR